MKQLEQNLDKVIEQIRKDFDYCLAITGKKRRGKSTLGYEVADYVSTKLNSKKWLCYGYWDKTNGLRNAIFRAEQYDVIYADEAISFLSNLDFNSYEAREFVRLFDMMGYKNLFFILIMPSFKSFVKGFRVDRIDAHIWIPERAHAFLYPAKENKEGVFFPDTPAIMDRFEALPDDLETEYRKIKEECVNREEKRRKEVDINQYRRLVNYIMRMDGVIQIKRANYLQLHVRTIKKYDKKENETGEMYGTYGAGG